VRKEIQSGNAGILSIKTYDTKLFPEQDCHRNKSHLPYLPVLMSESRDTNVGNARESHFMRAWHDHDHHKKNGGFSNRQHPPSSSSTHQSKKRIRSGGKMRLCARQISNWALERQPGSARQPSASAPTPPIMSPPPLDSSRGFSRTLKSHRRTIFFSHPP
jgi:hypothetical protein